ncbi:MAG TPA: HRDC domain-containing protein, partial [Bryobacteraceae bacterium]|nr:HRDC domain-containing protein [Bryobacteraceae bacterium]
DCVLLWQKRDIGLLTHFVQQMQDSAERERAWQRYHTLRRFVEQPRCRHRQICLHFGETPKWETCSMCDVCAAVPQWLAAPDAVQTRKRKRRGDSRRSAAAATPKSGASGLVEHMREWRRAVAKRNGVPAYVILHDSTLEEICRRVPSSLNELLEISGIGIRNAEIYGRDIFAVLAAYEGEQGIKAGKP